MLYIYFFKHPIMWVIPWILQSIGYFFILKKMGLRQWTAIVPFVAEREFCTVLMQRMRTFWRPFLITAIFVGFAYYLGPYAGLGRLYMMVAFLVYGFFMLRLYWRLCQAFKKSAWFYLGMILIAPLFLLILGLGKSEYVPLKLPPLPKYGPVQTILRKVGFFLVSAMELGSILLTVGFAANQQLMFPFLVRMVIQDVESEYKNIEIKDSFIANTEEVDANFLESLQPSREHFFPDHSGDKSVVVYSYLIGSDLEQKMGFCTININQMIEATKKGDGLKFVLEIGGAKRWFTKGVEDESYGRYVIEKGKITKVEDLPDTTNLSEEKELEDFLKWGKENYPADRNMLVFWDHGGGFTLGYGVDDVNETKESMNILSSTDIVSAIEASGLKFDTIGFDACLMQDIELAALLEPYTDYFLASEEVEGGLGWYYTPAFAKLAENPGIESEEFFKEMMRAYDGYNTTFSNNDGPQTSTLSVVDTTLVKPAFEKMNEFWARSAQAIQEDPKAFAYIGTAANHAYTFEDLNSIDLVGYLEILDDIDFDNVIYTEEQYDDLINTVQASVLYRNKNTFDGINGLAVTFPYDNMSNYTPAYEQMKNFSLNDESSMLNKFFSIIAYKKTETYNASEHIDIEDVHNFTQFTQWLQDITFKDYTQEDWYEAGFENYDTTPIIIDVPLEETEAGYKINLPDDVWNLILDCQTAVYKRNDDGSMVYLGSDYVGEDDENGHPMIDFDGHWVHINGQVVCYQAEGVRESEEGSVFYGQVPAMLNGKTEILLNVEWDATESGQEMPTGRVVGYEELNPELGAGLLEQKGSLTLEAGDYIQFMFQTFDESGNLKETKPAGKRIYITKQDRLTVEDVKVEPGDYAFHAVLSDIYQRTFSSEVINVTIK